MRNLIADLTENFALRIIDMYRYIRNEKQEHVMSLQVYRSGTSIGANVSESKNAQSKADFINKLSMHSKKLVKQSIGSNSFSSLRPFPRKNTPQYRMI